MAVLEVLAAHSGRVVPRDELLERVWPGVIVTEHTLSRCIYQLRRDLGKIGAGRQAAEFNPIETLPKRGYRLLTAVNFQAGDVRGPATTYVSTAAPIPFVVGQWVRGERFYGRSEQIGEILGGPRDCVWLLGTRRIGKTSLLRQVELVASADRAHRYFPVFWDFQGVDTPDELHLNFGDALIDAEEPLQSIGIGLEDVGAEDLFISLERLRRQLRSRDLRLLLLCDEVEELIGLQREQPSLLRKLRHAMQSREGIRTVLASTIRLWALADHREDTSPFLHGFAPPIYVARLSDEETQSLIQQSHLEPTERPEIDARIVREIREHCDNHPYLVQLVCKRYLESGNLDEAIEQVGTDRMVSYFFSVDFEMLSEAEQQIARLLTDSEGIGRETIGSELSLGKDATQDALRRMENLAFIRRDQDGRYALANYFFRRWLDGMPDPATEPVIAPAATSEGEVSRGGVSPSRSGFIAELRHRNVFRVGFAYILVAWVLLQVGEIVFGFLDVPGWAGKLLIVFLALGFPVALILAWAYQLTPQGLVRETDIDSSAPTGRRSDRRVEFTFIAILIAAALALALYRYV
jgi:hypothetical protein